MASPRGTKQETIDRANRFARIIANGGRRSDCIRFAAENWGVGPRSCDQYLALAREQLKVSRIILLNLNVVVVIHLRNERLHY